MKKIKAELLDTFVWSCDDFIGPATIQILLDLEPVPSADQLINSLKRTMAQVPLLACRMERGLWRDRWVHMPDIDHGSLLEIIDLPEDPSGKSFDETAHAAFEERADEKIDILKGPPVKMILFRQGSRGLLLLRFHHAIGDGNGCLQVAGLMGENLSASPDSPPPSPIPMNRSFFQLLRAFGLKDVPGIVQETVKEGFRPLIMPFTRPLIKEDGPDKSIPLKSSLARLVIEGDDYNYLQKKAGENGLTINDILVVGLLGLAGDMNSRLAQPSSRLAVTFSVNLRRFLKDPGVQITNLSALSLLISSADKVAKFSSAAAEVREKSGEMKRHYLGVGSGLAPNLMPRLMPSPIMHVFFEKYGHFVVRQIATHSLFVTNIGAMDSYLASFGDRLKHASSIATIFDFPVPLLTVTGYKDRITIYFGQLYRADKKSGLCKDMAGRLKYYLLEWPSL